MTVLSPPASIVSVQVGRPRTHQWLGRTLTTSIAKEPVAGRIRVLPDCLEGDEQADPRQHGGVDKAVYAYAAEDYAWWEDRFGQPIRGGTFGDNLTVAGLDLTHAVIGERWSVGTAVLEVSEPRTPCWKLGMQMGDSAFPRVFAKARRPGVLLRVVACGTVAAGDALTVVHRPGHGVTAADVNAMYYRDPVDVAHVLAAPQLAAHWREWIGHRTVWHLNEELEWAAEDAERAGRSR